MFISNKIGTLISFKFRVILLFLVSMLLVSCGGGSSGNNSTDITDAQPPTITSQLENATYIKDSEANALNVTASVTDGGTLSYQWYISDIDDTNSWSEISTSQTYTPLTDTVGTKYYYVKVTNTNNNVAGNRNASRVSNTAKITINEIINHTVNFYDKNLDLNSSVIVQENETIGDIATQFGISLPLYLTKSSTQIETGYKITENITFYAIPNVFEISNQTQLDDIRTKLSANYILLNNITLYDTGNGFDVKGWKPIGSYHSNDNFAGIFNGNNHTIANLWIDRDSDYYVGLFSYTSGARIKNLRIEINNNKVKGDMHVGGIVGYAMNSSISNSYVIGNVEGDNSVGGIAGSIIYGSNITDSYSIGNVSGEDSVGGIAGSISSSRISDSYSIGNVNGVDSIIGGIAGEISYSSISDSYSIGNVSGVNSLGGIVGYTIHSSTITNSYSIGNVSGVNRVGGIAGQIRYLNLANSYSIGNVSGNNELGGIVGYVQTSNFINTYSVGNVNGNIQIGGIAGYFYNSNITNSYSSGNIGGNQYIGGIIGYTHNNSLIRYNAAINPSVTGANNKNRVVGYIYDNNNISDNFALTVSGSFSNSNDVRYHGTNKNIDQLKAQITDELTAQTTYEDLGWGFGNNATNPWDINADENDGLPYFYWQND